MEDSYTVHRRRKAAAKRREKTPEPSSRSQLVDSSEDEEGARRARMEKMAEATERMETEKESRLMTEEQLPKVEEKAERKKVGKSGPAKVVDQSKRRSNEEDTLVSAPRARESDAGEETKTVSVKKEVVSKVEEEKLKKDEGVVKESVQETVTRSKENVEGEVTKVSEVRKVERRVKKKSKERLERQSRSTDSSEMDERGERSPRRTKSPESRFRVKKTSSKTKIGTGDSDGVSKDSSEKHKREKRVPSKPKVEGSEDQPKEKPERRHSRPYSQTEETDEDPKMKKSETFPRRSEEEPTMKRSATDVKKQIIPLSNDTLIQDFAKAQKDYLMRERGILDPDPSDASQDTPPEEPTLRRRKISVAHTENEQEEIAKSIEKPKETETKRRSWFAWLPFFGRKKEKVESDETVDEKPTGPEIVEKKVEKKVEEVPQEAPEKVTLMDFFRALRDVIGEFKAFVDQNPRETTIIRRLRNRCVAELILIIIYCGLGAFVFRFTEGAFETFYKCGVKRVKRDFLDSLWNYSHNLREDDWKSMARKKLMEFEEQLHTAHEAGVHTYSGQRSWTFLNAVVYCLTVITTIGYGHISPSTTTGRAITIVYAIFGIPMFLIILADFGKLFTRGIKFLWAFVRRLYYTGSCRKVRGTAPVQEVMKGVQLVYDLATFRRPSQINPEDIEEMQRQAQQPQTVLNLDGNVPDTPGTPAMSAFAIDDEFNLPISVAIFILLGYIFVGATLYYMWEDWGFFESFYFVFISMSTIGFGDYVPKHPMYMMCSIIYLVFGLALTSMCINVVQVMLSDSFKQASQKIGATIGFEVAEEDGTVKPALPPMVEIADVHVTMKEAESNEKIAPKAKLEDIEL